MYGHALRWDQKRGYNTEITLPDNAYLMVYLIVFYQLISHNTIILNSNGAHHLHQKPTLARQMRLLTRLTQMEKRPGFERQSECLLCHGHAI